MKSSYIRLASFFLLGLGACQASKSTQDELTFKTINLKYPKTEKVDQVDDYFGTKVADPYRWLEDDKSDETAAWVKSENEVTKKYLSKIPFRNQIKERMTEIWDYPKVGQPFKKGDFYYVYKNDGLQNQSVLYRKQNLEDKEKVFLDPNKLSEDGTIALGSTSFSKDGKYMAYSVSKSGSDWNEVYVINTETKEKLSDHIEWMKFSGMAWLGDGFYYSRYDEPKEGAEYSGKNEYHKVYFHKLGEDQASDKLIHEDKKNALRNFYAGTTQDEEFVILSGSEGTSGNNLSVRKAKDKKFVTLVDNFENDHNVLESHDGYVYILTNLDAPNNRLVKVNLNKPKPKDWVNVIPNSEHLLGGVSFVGGKMVVEYTEHATSKVYQYDYDGNRLAEVKLPGIGTVWGFDGKKTDEKVFFTYSSFTTPSNIYQYDLEKNSYELYRKSEIDFDVENYETKQVFYTSKDGTKVPMFITHKKGLELDGLNPTYLYAYGGFDISLPPRFSTSMLVWLENGGIFAQANLRGGGEYGQKWHEAGMKLKKQNVFDDFIAAGEYLIQEKYTKKERLAIAGGSNGGLLVGACMTQRPDLFQVAFPAVGVLDMLRYHKFTIGWAWAVEYGSSDEKDQFDNLYAYSPLHNVKDVSYPSTMILTADHDDRVVPAHSFKFAATLQEHHQGDNPVLIRIDTKAGHGAGKPTDKVIQEKADVFAFAWYNMKFNPQNLKSTKK